MQNVTQMMECIKKHTKNLSEKLSKCDKNSEEFNKLKMELDESIKMSDMLRNHYNRVMSA